MRLNMLTLIGLIILFIACDTNTINTPEKKILEPKEEKQVQTNLEETSQMVVSDRWSANEYRDKKWKPEEGLYFFSEVWTWAYTNEMLPENDPYRTGKMSIYIDTPTGTILLTRADTKYQEEMTNWIIIQPEGKYMSAFTDEHGKKRVILKEMKDFPDHEFNLKHQQKDFEKYFTELDESKIFGENKYNNPTISANKHIMTFEQTFDQAELFLAQIPFSLRAFYLVSKTNMDLRLPIPMDYGYLLPKDYLVVSETYENNGQKFSYHLESMGPTEYFINTMDYRGDH